MLVTPNNDICSDTDISTSKQAASDDTKSKSKSKKKDARLPKPPLCRKVWRLLPHHRWRSPWQSFLVVGCGVGSTQVFASIPSIRHSTTAERALNSRILGSAWGRVAIFISQQQPTTSDFAASKRRRRRLPGLEAGTVVIFLQEIFCTCTHWTKDVSTPSADRLGSNSSQCLLRIGEIFD